MSHAFSHFGRAFAAAVAALAAIAVSAADPLAGTAQHNRDGHFQNNYLDFEPKEIGRASCRERV